jgi:hypothetical protein
MRTDNVLTRIREAEVAVVWRGRKCGNEERQIQSTGELRRCRNLVPGSILGPEEAFHDKIFVFFPQ